MSKKQNKNEEEKIKEFFIGDNEVNKEQEKIIKELKEGNKYDDYINNGINVLTKFLGNNQLAQEIDRKYKDIYDKCVSKKDDKIICDTNLLYDYLFKNDEIKNCLVEMNISEDVGYEKSKRFFIFDNDSKEENKEENEMSNKKEENKINKVNKKEINNETKKKEEKKNEKVQVNKEDNSINKKIEDEFSRNKKNFILFDVYPDELKDYKNRVRNLTLTLVNNNRKAMKKIINYKDFYELVNKSKEDIYNFIWYNKDLLKYVIKEMYGNKNTDINIEDYESCKKLFNFNKMIKINKSKKSKVKKRDERNKIIDATEKEVNKVNNISNTRIINSKIKNNSYLNEVNNSSNTRIINSKIKNNNSRVIEYKVDNYDLNEVNNSSNTRIINSKIKNKNNSNATEVNNSSKIINTNYENIFDNNRNVNEVNNKYISKDEFINLFSQYNDKYIVEDLYKNYQKMENIFITNEINLFNKNIETEKLYGLILYFVTSYALYKDENYLLKIVNEKLDKILKDEKAS